MGEKLPPTTRFADATTRVSSLSAPRSIVALTPSALVRVKVWGAVTSSALLPLGGKLPMGPVRLLARLISSFESTSQLSVTG